MSPTEKLNNKPAVVICHGSYHTPAPYGPFMQSLKSHAGFETVHCPQRPTCDLSRLNVGDDLLNPDFDLGPPSAGGYPSDTEDVDVVIQVLDKLVNKEGKDVILLAHSSGGWVASQAAIPEYQLKARGKKGGIIGIFYFGALVVPVGESVNSFFQPKDGTLVTPPYMRFHKHGHDGLGTPVNAPYYMFNGVPPEEATKWAKTLTASPAMHVKLTNDAYSALPCAYLVLDDDKSLPREYQEGMIALQGQQGNVFTVYHAPSGHSPHLSWTMELVEKVDEFVRDISLNEY